MRLRLARFFAHTDDPYAGVDLVNASRFGAALWFFGAFLSAVFLPFDQPTDAIGDAGWIVAGVVIASSVAAGVWMRGSGPDLSWRRVVFLTYASLGAIAILVWLAGGFDAPYTQLYLLSAVFACAVHPPRRAVVFLGALVVCALLPLAYVSGEIEKRDVVDLAMQIIVWVALSVALMVLMHRVRAQRLGLRREGEAARRQARLDPLTGLLNRRAFDEDLTYAIGRALAGGSPLSVLVGDIDDFKDFNDRYGHLAGDRVLSGVAEGLRSALRRPDVAYRWGGDEFAVILPQADLAGAELVAKRVRAAVAAGSGPDGDSVVMKVGAAELDHDSGSATELVEAADAALLRAKGSGTFNVPRFRR